MLPELKPYLTALVMPPTLPLLVVFAGLVLIRRRRRIGQALAWLGALSLWLLSANAPAVWLHNNLIPGYPSAQTAVLQQAQVQAIVILGGGIETGLPDGVAQLKRSALDRLRHGAELSRASGLPIMATGGVGWGAKSTFASASESEAQVTARVARDAFGIQVRWQESASRDTHENARNAHQMLAAQGITRIALVTHSWHMPRSVKAFEQAGFVVTPAPMGHPVHNHTSLLEWLPGSGGLETSHAVLRERLAWLVQR